jgi:hypothetical protein
MQEAIARWEAALDNMGVFATPEQYLEHYRQAPKGAPSLGLLERILRTMGAL